MKIENLKQIIDEVWGRESWNLPFYSSVDWTSFGKKQRNKPTTTDNNTTSHCLKKTGDVLTLTMSIYTQANEWMGSSELNDGR